jgi:hypothetical protein
MMLSGLVVGSLGVDVHGQGADVDDTNAILLSQAMEGLS